METKIENGYATVFNTFVKQFSKVACAQVKLDMDGARSAEISIPIKELERVFGYDNVF